MIYLGKNIRYLRKSHNLSQEDIAEKFGYKNYTTIQKWESDESDPPLKVINSLAEYFHVDIDDLVKSDLESPSKRTSESADLSHEAYQIGKAYDLADEGTKAAVSKLLDVKRALDIEDLSA